MFACTGGDIVIVTAGEARYPRRDLPPVARFMYLAPISLYVITALFVGMNINYMNPDLYHPWEKPVPGAPPISHSPFIIVLENTAIAALPKFINACFLISAYTAGYVYRSNRWWKRVALSKHIGLETLVFLRPVGLCLQ
jgi:amino acid transporter